MKNIHKMLTRPPGMGFVNSYFFCRFFLPFLPFVEEEKSFCETSPSLYSLEAYQRNSRYFLAESHLPSFPPVKPMKN